MWWIVAVVVGSLLLSFAFAPKAQSQPPPEIGDVNTPTAEAGREIPVLFGTRLMEGPNVVWWGDVKTVAIKKKGGKK